MTNEQLAVLDHVRFEITEFGRAPTIREIAEKVGLSGPSAVHGCLNALVTQRKLRRVPGVARGLEIVDALDLRLAASEALRAELARRGETIERMQDRGPIPEKYWPTCAVEGCGIAVRYGHLMCRSHWLRVSAVVRDKVLRAHARGDLPMYQHLLGVARDEAVR